MKLILIVTTQNIESKEFRRFIDSLKSQNEKTKQNLIVILVNQDKKDFDFYDENIELRQIKSEKCSLSSARNKGLSLIEFESRYIVGFPDDDCWYNESVLGFVLDEFQSNEGLDFLCTGAFDNIRKQTYGKRRVLNHIEKINIDNAFYLPLSISLFVKNMTAKFDENFSVGTKWGSGEESDLVFQMLYENKNGLYNSHDSVYHEIDQIKLSEERSYRYALGIGALIYKSVYIRRQKKLRALYRKIKLRAYIAILIYLFKKNRRKIYLSRVRGMKDGFRQAKEFYINN